MHIFIFHCKPIQTFFNIFSFNLKYLFYDVGTVVHILLNFIILIVTCHIFFFCFIVKDEISAKNCLCYRTILHYTILCYTTHTILYYTIVYYTIIYYIISLFSSKEYFDYLLLFEFLFSAFHFSSPS